MSQRTTIADAIRNRIITGGLKEGTQVWGRATAQQHSVGFKTALAAFDILAGEGLLDNRIGVGYIVAAGARERAEKQGMETLMALVKEAVALAKALELEQSKIITMVRNGYRN